MVKIHAISLPFPFGMGKVNCYLLETGQGYVLIDTGSPGNRKALAAALEQAGCRPGSLQLVVLTHGDYDHTGNAIFLQTTYGSKVAMHAGDAGMLENGDMFFNRKRPNALLAAVLPRLSGFGREECGQADFFLNDGDSLADYGLAAGVVSIPGHSKGSIGILTEAGDFFCGDLLISSKSPGLNSLIDDMPAAQASLEKLAGLEIGTVYPGHGTPFPIQALPKIQPRS